MLRFMDNKMKLNLKRIGSIRKESGGAKMFFTPSFLNSVIKFEYKLNKKERISYLKKIAFEISLSDLLDQFLCKDS